MKVFLNFLVKLSINQENTLYLLGNFYRKDVLGDLQGTNHQNIRNFMKTGWEGIKFHRESLIEK
jgi:putative hopPmaJ type III effector